MKALLVPDSFKGTLSSVEVSAILCERILSHFPAAEVVSLPVADGGEGSVDCFLTAIGGERVTLPVEGPFFEEIEAFYGLLNGGRTAVIEMAAAAGLPLVEGRRDPLATTTYGVGRLLRDALRRGAKEILLCLGGSATCDFGCGAAAALGITFRDAEGRAFIPTGGTLSRIDRIERSEDVLGGVPLTLMCDVENPVYGECGAAYVYAPQKGASPEEVRLLDEGLRHVTALAHRDLGCDVSSLVGGGAAGAMAGGLAAFFGATLRRGIEAVLDTVGFDRHLAGADLVFTGEGKMDSQSLSGKVVSGVAARAKRAGVPVIAVVGGAEGDLSAAYEAGVSAVFPINRLPEDFSVSRYKSAENLAATVDDILRLFSIGRR